MIPSVLKTANTVSQKHWGTCNQSVIELYDKEDTLIRTKLQKWTKLKEIEKKDKCFLFCKF